MQLHEHHKNGGVSIESISIRRRLFLEAAVDNLRCSSSQYVNVGRTGMSTHNEQKDKANDED
jgi:hypothetical protein